MVETCVFLLFLSLGGRAREADARRIADGFARAVNIDAPDEEEAADDLAFAFDFGGDVRPFPRSLARSPPLRSRRRRRLTCGCCLRGRQAWEDLGYGSVPSWTTVPDKGSAGMEYEEEEGPSCPRFLPPL